ncbi:hypothetical protein RhiirA4_457491 [Rhizophagus irregularis]|uniref:Uncharacterized protein n=1 Tax=Rhizophagus irregularis TaxID=588596 RepID=A0A2I1GA50_9GLOM|nr:hypothetical protein RhiirA4_457491 [Rhizophagus irregularis]
MDLPKYNGNIHPDEWINDLQTYFSIKKDSIDINIVISLVDSTIKLPTGIDNIEKLREQQGGRADQFILTWDPKNDRLFKYSSSISIKLVFLERILAPLSQ